MNFLKAARTGCMLFAVTAAAGPVLAQTHASVGPGARIRITISSGLTVREIVSMAGLGDRVAQVVPREGHISVHTRDKATMTLPGPGATVEGILSAVEEDTVSVRAAGNVTISVPRRAIATLERTAGRRSRARYAGLGALLGTGIGALLAEASTDCSKGWCFVAPAFPGAILGAGAGAVIGAIAPPAPHWISADVASLSNIPEALPAPTDGTRTSPRLTVAFQLGVASSGPAADLEEAMRVHGFADTSFGFGGQTAHPVSSTGLKASGPATMLEIHYGLRASWSLGFMFARTPLGDTRGYRAEGFRYLSLEYQTITADAVLSRHVGPLRVGAGPAFHKAQVRDSTGPEQPWSSRSRVGFVAVAGARLPEETRVYLDLSFQYRYVGRTSVGPFTNAFGATLPASTVQFNHWLIGFGPGIRF